MSDRHFLIKCVCAALCVEIWLIPKRRGIKQFALSLDMRFVFWDELDCDILPPISPRLETHYGSDLCLLGGGVNDFGIDPAGSV